MHQESINIVQAEIVKRQLEGLCRVMVPVRREFRDDEDVRARDGALSNSTAYHVLHAIGLRRVNQSISILKGVDDRSFECSFIIGSRCP